MAGPELHYHADALRILSVEPRFDADAGACIAVAERQSGRRLPAALREWYTLAGAEEFLTGHDNACGVALLNDLLRELSRGQPTAEFYGPRRVNTGYRAQVRLDGPDDPSVLVDGEPGEQPFSAYVRWLAEWRVNGP